jgi:hypothetical protein
LVSFVPVLETATYTSKTFFSCTRKSSTTCADEGSLVTTALTVRPGNRLSE